MAEGKYLSIKELHRQFKDYGLSQNHAAKLLKQMMKDGFVIKGKTAQKNRFKTAKDDIIIVEGQSALDKLSLDKMTLEEVVAEMDKIDKMIKEAHKQGKDITELQARMDELMNRMPEADEVEEQDLTKNVEEEPADQPEETEESDTIEGEGSVDVAATLTAIRDSDLNLWKNFNTELKMLKSKMESK